MPRSTGPAHIAGRWPERDRTLDSSALQPVPALNRPAAVWLIPVSIPLNSNQRQGLHSPAA